MVVKIDEHTVDDEADHKPRRIFEDALESGSHGLTIYADRVCR